MSRLIVVVLLALLPAYASTDPDDRGVRISSGDKRVSLVELFTSEGCSSCPPAESWLNALESDENLWREFVPVAFHVDYWDYIGWKDRYASEANSDRQRRYARDGGARFVYTPGFFLNGMEWLGWRRDERDYAGSERPGSLDVLLVDDDVAVHWNATHDMKTNEYFVHIALLGMNLETEVRAGENRGRRLQHDFVALHVTSLALDPTASGYRTVTTLPAVDPGVADRALIAWISRGRHQAPIQAAGGFLDRD